MIIIKNANLVNMAGIEYEICDIMVEGSKIKEIGKIEVSKYPDATVIDAENKLVTPGLIDAHCHIGLFQDGALKAGSDGNEMTDPIVPNMKGIESIKPQDGAFAKALDSGVTTVITGPGSGEIIAGTFAALKTYGTTIYDMCFKEEVAMKMALGENPKRCFGEKGKMPMTRMGIAAMLREALTKAKKYDEAMKKYEADPTNEKEPAYDAKMEALAKVFNGLPVKIHAHQQDDIVTGIRMMEEFGLKGTIDHCTAGYLIKDVLKEKNVGIIIGPTLGDCSKFELMDKSFDGGKVYEDAGIDFALMTDHPVIPLEHTRTQAAIYVNHGVSPMTMMKSLTINAAKLTGVDDRVGSIEVGKDADIVIWTNDDIFHYMTNTATILVNGKIVK